MTPLLWNRAENELAVLILAHGAGAPMDSEFMEDMAQRIVAEGITVVRFEFPYMAERRVTGKKRPPDRAPKLLAYWQEVIAAVHGETADTPLFIGGKSMGGRMATLVASDCVEQVSGVVCLGYPFYAMGKPEKPRIEHLKDISLPVLVVQGERDSMGNRETVEGYELSEQVQVAWLEDGNHDLKPRKASGFTEQGHRERCVERVVQFVTNNHQVRGEEAGTLV